MKKEDKNNNFFRLRVFLQVLVHDYKKIVKKRFESVTLTIDLLR